MITKAQIDAAMAAFEAEPDILPGATLRDQIAAAIVAAERAAWQPIEMVPYDETRIILLHESGNVVHDFADREFSVEHWKRIGYTAWRHALAIPTDDSVPFFS